MNKEDLLKIWFDNPDFTYDTYTTTMVKNGITLVSKPSRVMTKDGEWGSYYETDGVSWRYLNEKGEK